MGSSQGVDPRVRLGTILMLLQDATPANDVRGAGFFKRGCDLGNALSCENLGMCYVKARGAPHDETRAAELFTRACNAHACTSLGMLRTQNQVVAPGPTPLITRMH